MTEKHKRILNKIGKVAAYMALTGGSYILARGVEKNGAKKYPKSEKARESRPA